MLRAIRYTFSVFRRFLHVDSAIQSVYIAVCRWPGPGESKQNISYLYAGGESEKSCFVYFELLPPTFIYFITFSPPREWSVVVMIIDRDADGGDIASTRISMHPPTDTRRWYEWEFVSKILLHIWPRLSWIQSRVKGMGIEGEWRD